MTQNQIPSLRELDNEIIALKKRKKPTPTQKAELEELKSEYKKAYAKLKHLVLEFEKTNRQYLILMPSNNGFRKMFEHSALFYTMQIAPQLNLHANLQTDGDFGEKSKVGFVPFHNMTKIEERMDSQFGIKRCRGSDQPEGFPRQLIVYRLPWEFDDEEVERFESLNDSSLQEFNHKVLPNNLVPVLYLALTELNTVIFQNVRRMSQAERDFYGEPAALDAKALVLGYLSYANGEIEREEYLNSAIRALTDLEYHIKVITDLKLWKPQVTARIAKLVVKISGILNVEAKLAAKAKREAKKVSEEAEAGKNKAGCADGQEATKDDTEQGVKGE